MCYNGVGDDMLEMTLLDKDKRYIVGVSGGMDSMALLDMLYKANFEVVVAHYNYHFRDDSDIDEELVRNYCLNHNITIYVREGNVLDYQKGNFEMLAREKRYDFYHEIGLKEGINEVVLGHHLNDFLENVVMQIKRNNLEGYLGIKEKSVIKDMLIIRPLLKVKKEELKEYCLKNKVAYHDDYTNLDLSYTRNYVRHVDLKKYDVDDLLAKANNHNRLYLAKEKELESIYLDYDINHYLDLRKIHDLDKVIYYMLKKDIYPPLISKSLIDEIIKQLNSNKPNLQIPLPVNFMFIKMYHNITVRKKESDDNYSITYTSFKKDQQTYFFLNDQGHLNEGIYLSEDDYPITIRCFKNGDRIKTAGGNKKVARLFIDNKIPSLERKTWPIVENSSGEIILIPHIAKNIKYLATKPNVFVIKYDTCK